MWGCGSGLCGFGCIGTWILVRYFGRKNVGNCTIAYYYYLHYFDYYFKCCYLCRCCWKNCRENVLDCCLDLGLIIITTIMIVFLLNLVLVITISFLCWCLLRVFSWGFSILQTVFIVLGVDFAIKKIVVEFGCRLWWNYRICVCVLRLRCWNGWFFWRGLRYLSFGGKIQGWSSKGLVFLFLGSVCSELDSVCRFFGRFWRFL